MAVDERLFYAESQTTKSAPLNCPHCRSVENYDLRWMVLGFAGREWQPTRILPDGTDIDPNGGRLSADVMGPDSVVRTITGQPDLIIADPPDGIVIVDYKSGRGQPKAPRDDRDAEVATGKQYLSERGHFQLDSYGLMAMRKYPAAQRAILRELHLRSGKVREAVLAREEIEHVEREIGLHLMLLDQAIQADDESDPLWKPRPGAWCARACPVNASCPIPAEQRGVGALDTDDAADAAAARYVTMDGVRNTLRDQLKTRYEQTGRPSFVGDGTAVFWKEKDDGRRSFGVWPVEDIPTPPQADDDLEVLLAESVKQAEEGRA